MNMFKKILYLGLQNEPEGPVMPNVCWSSGMVVFRDQFLVQPIFLHFFYKYRVSKKKSCTFSYSVGIFVFLQTLLPSKDLSTTQYVIKAVKIKQLS